MDRSPLASLSSQAFSVEGARGALPEEGVLQPLLAVAQWVGSVRTRSSNMALPQPHSQNGQAIGDPAAASAWPGENCPETLLTWKPEPQRPPAHSGALTPSAAQRVSIESSLPLNAMTPSADCPCPACALEGCFLLTQHLIATGCLRQPVG